ncbi:hypothetical protein COEREDRAFT_6364 [Coemansia reversa NRRL 1564]|uniref:Uncharacterized protein n=1 Tax=Coemansia reversa (strain ATCC 12441 / NRRL 1564) TaxID=763665 RepID=A0A2G5BIR8_COERN|nr:hypothetical protein COEREDRAFT_6364 [Coemansia reversa NRRL 1564]|eukprot:PIA18657.1 hypothetical protein COEREDRAFT_6364 [Coemansia reversa NRRL 1564]
MTPRENSGLRVYSDSMPVLEELTVGHMEPNDSRLPLALPADAALAPCLRGLFFKLVRIKAPVFDIHSLPAQAPALRSLCITRVGGLLSEAIGPSSRDIDKLVASGLPLKSVVVAGKAFVG